MITIEIKKEPLRIVSRGHATGAGLAGANLVCCAVSTLLYTLLSAAEDIGALSDVSLADGFMDLAIGPGERAACMVHTVVTGLESLAAQYPAYITIKKERTHGGA